jgi:DnaK suppressor protein
MNIDHYRRLLLALEQKLVQRLGAEVATARDASLDQPDVSDLAQVDELKEEYFDLAETDSAILAEVRAALARIADGTYGRCTVDGGPIDEKRLESVPWTPYCLKHQLELEERAQTRTPSL